MHIYITILGMFPEGFNCHGHIFLNIFSFLQQFVILGGTVLAKVTVHQSVAQDIGLLRSTA